MSVQIYKNFLSIDECRLLNEHAINNIDNWFGSGVDNGQTYAKNRITTRLYMGNKKYTSKILEISDRVRTFIGVDKFSLIDGHGSDGIVCSITSKGGDVKPHRDPRSIDGLPTYRCNILTQANEDGAELYVDEKKIDIEVGDLHCYFASELKHYVTEAKGQTSRIMWMFGAHIPKQYWKNYGLSQ